MTREPVCKKASSARAIPISDERAWRERMAACVANPKLMQREIRQLRAANYDGLNSDDEAERSASEWFCSKQRIVDSADPTSFFDHGNDHEYSGGPPVFHPHHGPRDVQEIVRDLIREFREAAMQVFPSRQELHRVYIEETVRSNLELPYELWGEGWRDEAWIAHLYISGMRSLRSALWAVSDNWPHAFRMTAYAQSSLRAMGDASMRSKLVLAERESLRASQLADAQQRGASARREFSEATKDGWRQIRAERYPDTRYSNRRAAELICKSLGMDESKVETVRKALGRKKLVNLSD
jgi:hypothetical protein